MKNDLLPRRFTGPALLLAVCLSGVVALVAASRQEPAPRALAPTVTFVERQAAPPFPLASSITPITSLTASCPAELGGSCSTTGSLYASADRIDIYARTSSSTATVALVEYLPADGKWVQHGTCPTVTTDLTLCRVVAKRGARYWHVYKSAGTLAYAGIEAALGSVGLGSIEYAAPGLTSPVGVANGGTGLTSFTANRLLYSSSTSAIGQLGCSDGQVATWASGAIACATPATGGAVPILQAQTASSRVTSTQQYIYFFGRHDSTFTMGSTTASSLRVFLPAGLQIRLRAAADGTVSSPDGTYQFNIRLHESSGSMSGFSEVSAARVEIVNSDGNTGAGAGKTGATHTVPSGGRYYTIGVIYVGGASLAMSTSFGLEQVP